MHDLEFLQHVCRKNRLMCAMDKKKKLSHKIVLIALCKLLCQLIAWLGAFSLSRKIRASNSSLSSW